MARVPQQTGNDDRRRCRLTRMQIGVVIPIVLNGLICLR